ncbi:MAG: zf-TFIIB domain-containing protein [Caulobacteraceae bacterium]|nr:zf-TFIIB domain-containing protein [Caulobacteraceae bacterium]
MPLLLCPNDNAAMQTINRNGVELDVCPTCRGVWLDRGELEKLLEGGRAEQAERRQADEAFQREITDFHRDPDAWRKRHPYDDREKRYRYDSDDYHRGHKKKRGFDLFDIFD